MSDDEDLPERSRQTRWRRSGPKRKGFREELETIDDDDAGQEDPLESVPGGTSDAVTGCQDDDGQSQSHMEVSSEDSEGGTSSLAPRREGDTGNSQAYNQDDGDSGSDCWLSDNDYEMRFLEEDREESVAINDRPGCGGSAGATEPDSDPDDPDFHFPSSDSASDSDLEDDDQNNFNFDHASMNRRVHMSVERSVRDLVLLDLALSVRHKLTYECLMDMFTNKNVIFGEKFFPTSKKELWRILGRNSAGLVEHVYCAQCKDYIGKKTTLPEIVQCGCGSRFSSSTAKFFVSLSVRKQLQHFLSTPGIGQVLNYRETRTKRNENAIEDIFDGEGYKLLQAKGHALPGSFDYTYVFNTDGCKIRKGAKTNIYPLFLRLNEIQPQLRQKFMFLAGVFVDTDEPSMVSFLTPFVQEMNRLAERGINWTPTTGGQEVESKFFPVCFCVDGKARYQVLNMSSHNANFGCTYCTISGVSMGHGHTMRYPALPHPAVPQYEDRTDQGMKEDMITAFHTRLPVRGHKGPTPLMLMRHIDLRRSNAGDDLHILYECAAPHITELLLNVAPRTDRHMGYDHMLDIIDARMAKIKTPSNISRKPGTCSVKNRNQWTGTEWRNWTLYYGVPCLHGLITDTDLRHFQLLSRAAYLLSMDIITENHIVEAENCFSQFLEQNETKYGIEKTKLNLHATSHLGVSVRNCGPLWAYSTFNFESWNHRVIKTVTSPHGALNQIVNRHLINISLNLTLYAQENISEAVKSRLEEILKAKRRAHAQKVCNGVYVIGKGRLRNPTAAEAEVLQQEGMPNVGQLQQFDKVIINSSTYCSFNPNLKSRSDNCTVYTYLDTFCSIQSIVLIEKPDGTESCGLFVLEHAVAPQRPFRCAGHISSLLPDNDLLHLISATDVRSSTVKVFVAGNTYVIPLPNQNEID